MPLLLLPLEISSDAKHFRYSPSNVVDCGTNLLILCRINLNLDFLISFPRTQRW